MAKGKDSKNISMCETRLVSLHPGLRRALKSTLSVFRDVCKYLGDVAEERWPEISEYGTSQERMCFLESLVHSTQESTAMYSAFDEMFYKFPSYYRRSAINFVLGQVSSYHTRLEEYNTQRKHAIDKGKRFREKPPVLNLNTNVCPSMYKGQMFKRTGRKIFLKVFIRNTWDWVEVAIPESARKDLDEKAALGKVLSPSLCYQFHNYYLKFPIEYRSFQYPVVPLEKQTVLAVDLGVNRGATACVLDASGTVLSRHFDPLTSERDRMDHLLGKIKRAQKESGTGQSVSSLYTKLDGVKQDYVRKLARWITDTAVSSHVYGVVLENLRRMGRSHNARIHHWCKCRIRDYIKSMCRREGIRVFLINPRNTSALAYDGSGKVERGEYPARNGQVKYNYSVCVFASGKQYNCDLNASYNIGARYFIRAYAKTMPETAWSQAMAKVPALAKRNSCTLSTLWELAALQPCGKSTA